MLERNKRAVRSGVHRRAGVSEQLRECESTGGSTLGAMVALKSSVWRSGRIWSTMEHTWALPYNGGWQRK